MDAPTQESTVAGIVAELWRFPIKSFQGERLDVGGFTTRGLVGDRRYALRHTETGEVITAKRYGRLLDASARTEGEEVVVDLPDGGEWAAADPALSGRLSEWLELPVRLAEAGPGDAPNFVMSFNAEEPEQDLFEWPVLEGTFQDLAPVHALTTQSLAAAEALAAGTRWDVRRFRPTLLLDTGTAPAFVEDAWVGHRVTVGGLELAVTMPTIRCPMPSRAQPGLERDTAVAATLRDHHENNLGIYADITTPGTVRVGDPVVVAH